MMRWFLPGFLSLWSAAGLAQECDEYGLITPTESDGYTGSELIFRIRAANIPLCGDASSCVWELDGEPDVVGTIESEDGSPAIWTAPAEIDDCSGYTFQVIAQCSDAAQIGTALVTMYCDDEDKDALQEQSRNTTVEGGGCGRAGPAEALAILPLFMMGWRRR
jgi:hypothetical protein